MSGKITSPTDHSGFNVDALSGLADAVEDTAKQNVLPLALGGGTKELTGQELKQIVAEAKDAIADAYFAIPDAKYQAILTDAQAFIQGQLNVQQAPGQQAPIQQGQTLIDQQARALNKTSTYNELQARRHGSFDGPMISNLSIA